MTPFKTRNLGSSKFVVPEVCLGTMTFGEQTSEADAHAQLDFALAAGIGFIDTAEMYAVPPAAEPVPAQAPPVAPSPVAPAVPAAALPALPAVMAPTPPAPERKGWLDKLKAGLRKTGSSIATVFTGTQIDDALYEELEAALLMADTGVKATEHLLADLKKRVKDNKTTDPAAVKGRVRKD